MSENTVVEKESVQLSPKLEEIAKQIEGLTALELSELVKGLEDRFGIEAAMPMAAGMMMPAGGGAGAGAQLNTRTNTSNNTPITTTTFLKCLFTILSLLLYYFPYRHSPDY